VLSKVGYFAKARVQSQDSPCTFCGGQSGTGAGLPPSICVFPCHQCSTLTCHHPYQEGLEQYVYFRLQYQRNRPTSKLKEAGYFNLRGMKQSTNVERHYLQSSPHTVLSKDNISNRELKCNRLCVRLGLLVKLSLCLTKCLCFN